MVLLTHSDTGSIAHVADAASIGTVFSDAAAIILACRHPRTEAHQGAEYTHL